MKKTFIILLFGFLLSGCNQIKVTQAQSTIEAGIPFNEQALIEYDRERLIVTTPAMQTIRTLGETTVVFEAVDINNNDKRESFEFTFDVIDTSPPIIESEENIVVYQDMPLNVLDHITIYDNVDTISVESVSVSEFNTSIIGNQTVELQVSDNSNNKTTTTIQIEVIERKTFDNTTFRIEPMYGMGWGFYAPFIDELNNSLTIQMTFETNDPGYDVKWPETAELSLTPSFDSSNPVQFIDSTYLVIPLDLLVSNPHTIYVKMNAVVNDNNEEILITFLNLNRD